MLAVAVDAQASRSYQRQSGERDYAPQQPVGSFLGKGSTANGDALLSAQKRRFLFRFQIDET